jgi:hypothetical protein
MVLQNFYARSLLICFYVAHNLELRLVGKVVLIRLHRTIQPFKNECIATLRKHGDEWTFCTVKEALCQNIIDSRQEGTRNACIKNGFSTTGCLYQGMPSMRNLSRRTAECDKCNIDCCVSCMINSAQCSKCLKNYCGVSRKCCEQTKQCSRVVL